MASRPRIQVVTSSNLIKRAAITVCIVSEPDIRQELHENRPIGGKNQSWHPPESKNYRTIILCYVCHGPALSIRRVITFTSVNRDKKPLRFPRDWMILFGNHFNALAAYPSKVTISAILRALASSLGVRMVQQFICAPLAFKSATRGFSRSLCRWLMKQAPTRS